MMVLFKNMQQIIQDIHSKEVRDINMSISNIERYGLHKTTCVTN